MKIAIVSPLWGPAYPTGSGVYAYELAIRMAALGHEVHVFTSQTGNFLPMELPGNLHLRILRTYKMLWSMNPLANVFPILLREDFDVVHVHSYIFLMSNSAAAARALRSFRYVLNFHGGMSHNGMPRSCTQRMWVKDNIFDRTLGRATVRLADEIVSVSKSDIPQIERTFGVSAQYIPNAVSTEKFNPAENGSRVITYVGKLEQWKGAGQLLGIFKRVNEEVSDVKFRIIGDGSLAGMFRRTNIPLELMGHVPHEKMPAFYQDSAISVLPSYMEGAPTTCMESLACGVPCVATRVGDTPEIVSDGKTGFLVDPGDIDASASRLIELLEDETLRRRMGAQGRQHMLDRFSYDKVVRQMLNVYSA